MTPSPLATALQTERLIVMVLGKLTIACPIETVYKVVHRAQVHSSGQGYTGVAYIDEHAVVVIDLHQKLFNTAIADEHRYFVIIKHQCDDLVAIPVISSPNLMDIPQERIKQLPAFYRQSDILGLASHIAIVPDGERTLTIFILDEKTLL